MKELLLAAGSGFIVGAVFGLWFGLYKFSDYVENVRQRLKILDGKLDSKLDQFAAWVLRLKDKF